MYINKMKALIQIGIWSILFVLALPIMFGCFGAAIENGTPETVPVLLLLGFLSVLVLAGYVRVFALCSHLLAFGNCLRSDTDGSVSAADAAAVASVEAAAVVSVVCAFFPHPLRAVTAIPRTKRPANTCFLIFNSPFITAPFRGQCVAWFSQNHCT